MFHLGTTNSSREEWNRASAAYGRLEVVSHPEVVRSVRDFPSKTVTYQNPRQTRTPTVNRVLRRSLFDLGHVQCRSELGNLSLTLFLELILLLELKLARDFPFVEQGDVFVLRVAGTSSTIWQRRVTGSVMLFKIPQPFADSFGCTAEWEFNTQTHAQSLRLDFLFRLTQPPAATFEGVPYHCNLRSALSGGVDRTLDCELQRIYRVNHIFKPEERRSLLQDLGFDRLHSDHDAKWIDFIAKVTPEVPVARVELAEFVDVADSFSPDQLSDNALLNLQYLRYQRRASSGKL